MHYAGVCADSLGSTNAPMLSSDHQIKTMMERVTIAIEIEIEIEIEVEQL